MKEQKFLPEGYEYLKIGDQVQVDDYYWSSQRSRWLKIRFPDDTSTWKSEHVIRKIKDDSKNNGFR